jgi:hypothetical protein
MVMVALVGYGTKMVYDWEPEIQQKSAIRGIALCAGMAFLSHLILNVMTVRSFPLLGKVVN